MRKIKKSSGGIPTTPDESHRRSYVAMLARFIAADIDRDTGSENEKMRRNPIFLKESDKATSKRASSGTT